MSAVLARPAPGDQAEGLRRMLGLHLPRVVNLVAGCAGTGRTTLAVHLAAALAREGRRVLLVDGCRRMGNASDVLGLKPRYELAHALSGERALEDVVQRAPGGFMLLPAARGLQMLEAAPQDAPAPLARLLGAADVALVDAAAGEAGLLRLALHARQEAVVTTTAGADAITRTYAWLKRGLPAQAGARLRLVVCRAASEHEARAVHDNLADVAGRHLGLGLQFLGALGWDPAIARGRAAAPLGEASAARLRAIAARLYDDTGAAQAWPRKAA